MLLRLQLMGWKLLIILCIIKYLYTINISPLSLLLIGNQEKTNDLLKKVILNYFILNMRKEDLTFDKLFYPTQIIIHVIQTLMFVTIELT